MMLNQWIETTADWKENLIVMGDINLWKKDFRNKITNRLSAVLSKCYPEKNKWDRRIPVDDGLYWRKHDLHSLPST